MNHGRDTVLGERNIDMHAPFREFAWRRGTSDPTSGPSCRIMSIEKYSNGLPQVDPHRRTTKVNFSVVIGVLLFFGAMLAVAFWFASQRT